MVQVLAVVERAGDMEEAGGRQERGSSEEVETDIFNSFR